MAGTAWKLGNDIDTDAIIPGRFLTDWSKNPQKLKDNCFVDILPDFRTQVQTGDYVVAGANFGCGSSREGAPVAIKMSGVNVIIAESFARIFYRNCINVGLLTLESAEAARQIRHGDVLEVDAASGTIKNFTKNETYAFQPVPEFVKEILAAGGLAPYVHKRLAEQNVQKVQFPFGEGFLDLELPRHADVLLPEWVPGVLDALGTIRQALSRPVGGEKLRELALGKTSVAIVVNDATRPSPTDLILTAIMEELAAGGIVQEQVVVIVANGNHELATEDELKKIMGAWYSKLKIINHDCSDSNSLTYLGTTQRDLPIHVNTHFVDASLRILTGVIAPHQSAGFGGGRKSVVPGVSGIETIKKLHSFPIRPDGPVLGITQGNRFHEEVVAGARFAKPDFIVNVVKNYRGEMVDAVAGELEQAHAYGVRICEKSWVRKVEKPYDVVFVSAGRYPKDIDLHQSQKGLVVAEQVAKPGGTIVLLAECRNGIGKFGKVLKEAESVDAVISDFLATGSSEDNKGKAYLFARACKNYRVFVVTTGIDPKDIGDMFMTGFNSATEAASKALAGYENPSVLCIPYAGDCIPVLHEL